MIVGVDVSSRRIDLAWLENGKPCRWHQELGKGHLIDRLRSIRVEWPRTPGKYVDYTADDGFRTLSTVSADVTEIAIEYPFGRGNAIAALMATVGVITRQAPPWSRVAWPSSQELRAAIGARNTKEAAHKAVMTGDADWFLPLLDWDEHELDALTACIGWTRILQAQDAA